MLYIGYIGADGGLEQAVLTPEMIEVHPESPHGHVTITLPKGVVIEIPLVKYQHALRCRLRDEAASRRTVIYP